MNYKESAAKLNEFSDFMDCVKENCPYVVLPINLYGDALIAWRVSRLMGYKNINVPLIISKDQFALHTPNNKKHVPAGPTLKNDCQSVMLSKEESIFSEKPYTLHDTGAFHEPILPNNEHLEELLKHIKNKTK